MIVNRVTKSRTVREMMFKLVEDAIVIPKCFGFKNLHIVRLRVAMSVTANKIVSSPYSLLNTL
jgi:hypothetical protein